MDVGARIQELRTAKGYTINRLANKAGISQSYLRDIELGRKNPTVNVISEICWALGLSLQEFFSSEQTNALLEDDIVRLFYQLTAEQRQALVSFLKTFCSV